MPLYSYQCPACHYTKDITQDLNSDETLYCAPCKRFMKRSLSAFNLYLKGPNYSPPTLKAMLEDL